MQQENKVYILILVSIKVASSFLKRICTYPVSPQIFYKIKFRNIKIQIQHKTDDLR